MLLLLLACGIQADADGILRKEEGFKDLFCCFVDKCFVVGLKVARMGW